MKPLNSVSLQKASLDKRKTTLKDFLLNIKDTYTEGEIIAEREMEK